MTYIHKLDQQQEVYSYQFDIALLNRSPIHADLSVLESCADTLSRRLCEMYRCGE